MQRNLYANTKMTKKKLTVKFKGIPRTIEEEEQYFRDRVKLAKDAPLNVDDTKKDETEASKDGSGTGGVGGGGKN